MNTPRNAGRAIKASLERLLTMVDAERAERARSQPGLVIDRDPALAVEGVGNWLYEHWYSVLLPPTPLAPAMPGREDIVPLLRMVGAMDRPWEAGWIVVQTGRNGGCVASRAGAMRTVGPGDFANRSRPAAPAVPGDSIDVLDRLDWVDEPTAFWGRRSPRGEPAAPLARVYVSTGQEHIATVLARLLPALETLDLRWSLKCPTRASDFARVDSIVLYIERGDWERVRRTVVRVARGLNGVLRDAVPPLTLRIGRGLAFAENPEGAQSFGMHRCRALAPGVIELLDDHAPRHGRDVAFGRLIGSLAKHGVDPVRPWLCS
jgi:hypothetical protein